MKTVQVKDARIPALGFGTWQLKGEQCSSMVSQALSLGYRHIDTAQAYNNEEFVGQGLQNSRLKRDEVFLTTKVWYENFSPEKLISSVKSSLEKLQTDHVDLLLLHWPHFPNGKARETLEALVEARQQGLCKFMGVSNFTVKFLELAHEVSQHLVTNQVEYHPFLDQSTTKAKLDELDMALTAYSPLARGKVLENESINRVADKHGGSPAQISLAWLLAQRNVMAIPKASSKQHAEQNLKASEIVLDSEDIELLNGLSQPDGRQIDPSFAPDWDS